MKKRTAILLLLPALILNVAIILIPGILTILASFTDWGGVSLDFDFIGLQNYRELFDSPTFFRALFNNLTWAALFLTIPFCIALVASTFMFRIRRGKTIYQLFFLFPYVLAPVTNAIVWNNIIYSPIFGLIGYLNQHGAHIPSLLSNMNTALYAVAATDIWHYWGFLAVVFLAALRQTPTDQIEAAQIEGCSGIQLFRYVLFPNMLPTFKLMCVMSVINSFLTYDYVSLMTSGGPAHSTEMLSTLAYSMAFSAFQVGKAAAVAMFMCLFGLIASLVYTKLIQKDMMS